MKELDFDKIIIYSDKVSYLTRMIVKFESHLKIDCYSLRRD